MSCAIFQIVMNTLTMLWHRPCLVLTTYTSWCIVRLIRSLSYPSWGAKLFIHTLVITQKYIVRERLKQFLFNSIHISNSFFISQEPKKKKKPTFTQLMQHLNPNLKDNSQITHLITFCEIVNLLSVKAIITGIISKILFEGRELVLFFFIGKT